MRVTCRRPTLAARAANTAVPNHPQRHKRLSFGVTSLFLIFLLVSSAAAASAAAPREKEEEEYVVVTANAETTQTSSSSSSSSIGTNDGPPPPLSRNHTIVNQKEKQDGGDDGARDSQRDDDEEDDDDDDEYEDYDDDYDEDDEDDYDDDDEDDEPVMEEVKYYPRHGDGLKDYIPLVEEEDEEDYNYGDDDKDKRNEEFAALPCSLYLAPSSLVGAGLGLYSAVDIPAGQTISSSVLTSDNDNNNNNNNHHDDILSDELFVPVIDYYKTFPYRGQQRFLSWLGYLWAATPDAFYPTLQHDAAFPKIPPSRYQVHEGLSVAAADQRSHMEFDDLSKVPNRLSVFAPGVASLANSHPAHANIAKQAVLQRKDYARLQQQDEETKANNSHSPGLGAFTPHHGVAFAATQDIPAGAELLLDYGAAWHKRYTVKKTLSPEFRTLEYYMERRVPYVELPTEEELREEQAEFQPMQDLRKQVVHRLMAEQEQQQEQQTAAVREEEEAAQQQATEPSPDEKEATSSSATATTSAVSVRVMLVQPPEDDSSGDGRRDRDRPPPTTRRALVRVPTGGNTVTADTVLDVLHRLEYPAQFWNLPDVDLQGTVLRIITTAPAQAVANDDASSSTTTTTTTTSSVSHGHQHQQHVYYPIQGHSVIQEVLQSEQDYILLVPGKPDDDYYDYDEDDDMAAANDNDDGEKVAGTEGRTGAAAAAATKEDSASAADSGANADNDKGATTVSAAAAADDTTTMAQHTTATTAAASITAEAAAAAAANDDAATAQGDAPMASNGDPKKDTPKEKKQPPKKERKRTIGPVKHPLWLQDHGICVDRLAVGPSSVSDQAGRGAFAKVPMPAGSLVAAAPLLTLKREDLVIYHVRTESRTFRGAVDLDHVVGHEMLLNYCYGHADSPLLLLPYAPGVNFINHASNNHTPNARIQWPTTDMTMFSRQGGRHPPMFDPASWLSLHPLEVLEKSGELLLEIVALRDIEPNEEILIDYGRAWEEAWNRHVHDRQEEYEQQQEQGDGHATPSVHDAFRHEIGVPDGFYPDNWIHQSVVYEMAPLPSPLQPGDLVPLRWAHNGEVISETAYAMGLPPGFSDHILEYAKERGILKYYDALLEKNRLDSDEYFVFDTHGEQWFAQRYSSTFHSNLHYIAAWDEAARVSFLRALGTGGYDTVLNSIGNHFGYTNMTCFHASFMGVSEADKSVTHADVYATGNKGLNIIFPLVMVDGSKPELDIQSDNANTLVAVKYQYDMAYVLSDWGYHKTAPIEYKEKGQVRIVVGMYCGQIDDSNAEMMKFLYDGEKPAPFLNQFDPPFTEAHWGDGHSLPK